MGKYVYGIDLGTTYSCVAYLDESGKPVICKNSLEESTTPSVLQIVEGKENIVGKSAYAFFCQELYRQARSRN